MLRAVISRLLTLLLLRLELQEVKDGAVRRMAARRTHSGQLQSSRSGSKYDRDTALSSSSR